MSLNPGIEKTVRLLNTAGFRTIDSGDGITHDFECDRDFAYVVIAVDEPSKLIAESQRLKTLLTLNGVEVGPINDESTPQIQASYDPTTDFATIDLMFVSDEAFE
jgi:hypothetical protein